MPVLGQSASCKSCGMSVRSDDVSVFNAEHKGHDKEEVAASVKPTKAVKKSKVVSSSAGKSGE